MLALNSPGACFVDSTIRMVHAVLLQTTLINAVLVTRTVPPSLVLIVPQIGITNLFWCAPMWTHAELIHIPRIPQILSTIQGLAKIT